MNFFKRNAPVFDYAKFTSNLQAIRQTDSKKDPKSSANANEKMYALYIELYEALTKSIDGLRESDIKDSEAQELVGHFTMLISLAHVNYMKTTSKNSVDKALVTGSISSGESSYNL